MNLSIVFAFDLIFKLLVGERDSKGVHQEPFDVYVGTSLIHSNPNAKPTGLGSIIYIIYSLSLLISQCSTQRSHALTRNLPLCDSSWKVLDDCLLFGMLSYLENERLG